MEENAKWSFRHISTGQTFVQLQAMLGSLTLKETLKEHTQRKQV